MSHSRGISLIVALGFAALSLTGCKRSHANVKELTVAQALAAHESGAVFFDANSEDYRQENGKVPGAELLANYREYDPKQVLPEKKDTPLVFYCSNRL